MTTKQLRQNMPEVVKELAKGNRLELTYRGRVIGVLEPTDAAGQLPARPMRRGSPEAILDFIENNTWDVPERVRNDKRPIKEIIAEMRREDWEKRP